MGITLALAATKGGSGKSTLTVLLAGVFAAKDMTVSIIDSDPQHTVGKWDIRCKAANRGNPNIEVVCVDSDEALMAALANSVADVTLIDVQGAANTNTLPIVIQNANLIAIPCIVSEFDAAEIQKIPALLKAMAGLGREPTPYRVILNSVDGIEMKTKSFVHTVGTMHRNGLKMANVIVGKRTKYRELANNYGSLDMFENQDDSLGKAKAEIDALAEELLAIILGETSDPTRELEGEPANGR